MGRIKERFCEFCGDLLTRFSGKICLKCLNLQKRILKENLTVSNKCKFCGVSFKTYDLEGRSDIADFCLDCEILRNSFPFKGDLVCSICGIRVFNSQLDKSIISEGKIYHRCCWRKSSLDFPKSTSGFLSSIVDKCSTKKKTGVMSFV